MGKAKIDIKAAENYRSSRLERYNRSKKKTKSETIKEYFKSIEIDNIIRNYNEKGDFKKSKTPKCSQLLWMH